MKKILLMLSIGLMLCLSACGNSSSVGELSKPADVQKTKDISDNNTVKEKGDSVSEIGTEDTIEVSPEKTSTFKITRANNDTIIDNCIQSVEIIPNNIIQINMQEEKTAGFVEILDIFSEQTINLYLDDTLIATLEVDDAVRNGILEISDISEEDIEPLVTQLQSSIQSDTNNSDNVSREDKLYNVAVDVIGNDEQIENIAYDATDVKYLITVSSEDEALLIEFGILYKMKDDFDNMKVMFAFYTEKGKASSVIRRSTYSADVRASLDLDNMKDYHDLLNYSE